MKINPIPLRSRKVLVTAALPYSNGDLHVGHLGGAYVPADMYVRYLRLTGADVRFICGSDDHGVAIMITGEKEEKTPGAVADYYRARQANDFREMKIDFNIYSGTSSNPLHSKASQDFFRSMHDKGYFVKQQTRQFFDETRSAFLPDRYVQGTCGYCGTSNQNGDQCENCGKMLDVESLKDPKSILSGESAVIKETVHWFLDLSKFKQQVEDWVESAELREHTRAYVKGLIASGLVKRAMTRDLPWGIPVPLDDPDAHGKVLYVWFDAPIGYLSNTMELCEKEGLNPNDADGWWRSNDVEIRHFIGEDNTIFHCVIWIAMLSADGTLSLPRGVLVNQYFNIQFPGKEVEKISKSRGTAVWVRDLVTAGIDPDSVRFYLTSIATERARSVYKPDDLERRHNAELADTLGNFVNRITSFTLKHCGPEVPNLERNKMTERDLAFEQNMRITFDAVTAELEGCSFKAALERIMEFARECNRYIDEKAP
jgi:methionyl-tRNA synthetase